MTRPFQNHDPPLLSGEPSNKRLNQHTGVPGLCAFRRKSWREIVDPPQRQNEGQRREGGPKRNPLKSSTCFSAPWKKEENRKGSGRFPLTSTGENNNRMLQQSRFPLTPTKENNNHICISANGRNGYVSAPIGETTQCLLMRQTSAQNLSDSTGAPQKSGVGLYDASE